LSAFFFQPIAYVDITIAQRAYIFGRELKLFGLRELNAEAS